MPASCVCIKAGMTTFRNEDARWGREAGELLRETRREAAKASTRRNMLSNAVLNAAEFPDITVKSVSLTGTLEAPNADLEISVAGHTSTISMPFSLRGDAHHVIAAGSTELRQSALGLTPYSLMHGALQVQDAMQLKFKITVSPN